MRIAYFVVIVNLHWMAVGHVFSTGDVSSLVLTIATCARAAGFAAAIDFCFVAVALLSPLTHVFTQFFNMGIMRLSIHQIHLHRSMAVSGGFFAFLHIVLHAIAWCLDPNVTVSGNQLYSLTSIAFITGIFMVVGFVGAGVTGYELSINLSSPISGSLHLPLSIVGFIAFFGHGYAQLLGAPLGDYMVLGTFFVCVGSYIIFFFAVPVQRMEVDFKKSVWGDVIRVKEDHYMLVALKQVSSTTIPPGSFYNIYAAYDSMLSYTHGHAFPVFSARNGTVVFLIRCRRAKRDERISFTHRLLVMR
jgi:hypothetical protein